MQYLFVTVATLASISTSMAWKLSPNLGVPSCLYLNDYGEYDFTNIDCSTTAKLAACNSMCSLQDKGCDWAGESSTWQDSSRVIAKQQC